MISGFDDLCAALEVKGVAGFEDWLEGVHDENDWVSAQTDFDEHRLLTYIHQTPLQDVDFFLKFPCTLDDVWHAVHRMEEAVSRHQLVMYTPVDVFGTRSGSGNDISTLAKILYVEEAALADAVGGPWTPIEDGPVSDYNGDTIYQWFSRGDPATVWLGLGGDSVYLEPVTHRADGTPTIAEWPEPATANILYAESENYRLTEAEFLKRLRDNLADIDQRSSSNSTPVPRRKRRNMADHDVRLSTSNLRVAGIDLEFTVKTDGRTLGTLGVSEGGLLWRPTNRRKKNGVAISWAEFAEWAQS